VVEVYSPLTKGWMLKVPLLVQMAVHTHTHTHALKKKVRLTVNVAKIFSIANTIQINCKPA